MPSSKLLQAIGNYAKKGLCSADVGRTLIYVHFARWPFHSDVQLEGPDCISSLTALARSARCICTGKD